MSIWRITTDVNIECKDIHIHIAHCGMSGASCRSQALPATAVAAGQAVLQQQEYGEHVETIAIKFKKQSQRPIDLVEDNAGTYTRCVAIHMT